MDQMMLEKMCQAWMQGGNDIFPRKPFDLMVAEFYRCEVSDARKMIRFLKDKGYPV